MRDSANQFVGHKNDTEVKVQAMGGTAVKRSAVGHHINQKATQKRIKYQHVGMEDTEWGGAGCSSQL